MLLLALMGMLLLPGCRSPDGLRATGVGTPSRSTATRRAVAARASATATLIAAPAASEERIQTVTRARATVIGTAPTVTATAATVELADHDNTASGQNLAGIFALLDFYGAERRAAE